MSEVSKQPEMKDRWTCSKGYQRALQNEQQIETIISALQLDNATGLIDIGCGNGVFAIEAARRYPKCQVWACDPLQGAIAKCKEEAGKLLEQNLEVLIASAESVPLPDKCADRILMRNVLHHLRDYRAGFAEIGRLLREGGRFVLEAPCNAWDESTGKLLTDIHMLMDDSHRRTYLRSENILATMAGHGLHSEPVHSWTYPFKVGQDQVALVREHNAEEKLHLSKHNDGKWVIQLRMVRIIATRDAQRAVGGVT
jgi:SAM-dependent methyltransferase